MPCRNTFSSPWLFVAEAGHETNKHSGVAETFPACYSTRNGIYLGKFAPACVNSKNRPHDSLDAVDQLSRDCHPRVGVVNELVVCGLPSGNSEN
jgi:hypothetical protein